MRERNVLIQNHEPPGIQPAQTKSTLSVVRNKNAPVASLNLGLHQPHQAQYDSPRRLRKT
jgi:hypothetical protein